MIYFNRMDINQCLLHTDSHINKERLDWIWRTIFSRQRLLTGWPATLPYWIWTFKAWVLSCELWQNMAFTVGDSVQAVDQIGRWVGGKVIDVDGTSYLVAFDGYRAEFNMWFSGVAVSPQIQIAITKTAMVSPSYFSLLNIMCCLAHYCDVIVMLSFIQCYISGWICCYLEKCRIKSTVLDDPVSLVVVHVTCRRDPAGTGAESVWPSGAKTLLGLIKT